MVKRKVWSPFKAEMTGPSIDSGPMQYSRMAVDKPSASRLPSFFLPRCILSTSRLNLPSMSSAVPMTPPMASDMIKSTGYCDWGKWLMVAFRPMASDASPNPV